MLLWRLTLKRLPTRTNLNQRRMAIHLTLCPSCNVTEETQEHMFYSCSTAKEVRARVHLWWSLIPTNINLFDDWLCVAKSAQHRLAGSVLNIIMKAYIWLTWKSINQLVFESVRQCPKSMVVDIKLCDFTWFKHRMKTGSRVVWENQCNDPLNGCLVIFLQLLAWCIFNLVWLLKNNTKCRRKKLNFP